MQTRIKIIKYGLLLFVTLALILSKANAAVCQVNILTELDFGVYDPLATGNDDSQGRLEVCCQQGRASVAVAMSTGIHASNYFPRKMSNATDLLDYNIYRNGGRTQVWGDGSNGTVIWTSNVPNNQCREKDFFGRIPALRNVSPGAYTDTITVTATF